MIHQNQTYQVRAQIARLVMTQNRLALAQLADFEQALWHANRCFTYKAIDLYDSRIAGQEVSGMYLLLQAFVDKGTQDGLGDLLHFVFGKAVVVDYRENEAEPMSVSISVSGAQSAFFFAGARSVDFAEAVPDAYAVAHQDYSSYAGGSVYQLVQDYLPVGVVLYALTIDGLLDSRESPFERARTVAQKKQTFTDKVIQIYRRLKKCQ